MKSELQNLIAGNGQDGGFSLIKQAQIYLGGNENASEKPENQKLNKREEEQRLIHFAQQNNLFYPQEILSENFIGEGAEQKVYRLDERFVIKLNDAIFYEFWKDYFNSLLIHNYFFSATAYEFLGFKILDEKLYSVVKQRFIESNEPVDLAMVKNILKYNNFKNIRNHDYINDNLGPILEDLHDENIISHRGIPYFIDTIFYLTDNFHKK